MSKIEKMMPLSKKRADAKRDIDLINQYSIKTLTPEEVYCFSIVLCDNEVDRDMERFPNVALEKMVPLFLGKTGIIDHDWSAENQISRLYRTYTEKTGKRNSLGEELMVLRGDAYMLNNDTNKGMIEAIEGGIIKEVSVSLSAKRCRCSVCGENIRYNWRTGLYQCENGHTKGEIYEGKMCVGEITEPTDAYEFSFVAVPSQRGAGTIKSLEDPEEAAKLLLTADLNGCEELIKRLIPRLNVILEGEEERKQRAAILVENKKYLKTERKGM